ncbi:MAG TPA: FG-GAP-like repeat-containing protein [Vicinamibacteria bacterium]|nr:FG-GAP-like repeat-containing protein [Vicinamibacteria bacterium]
MRVLLVALSLSASPLLAGSNLFRPPVPVPFPEQYPLAVATGDLNGDGRTDVVWGGWGLTPIGGGYLGIFGYLQVVLQEPNGALAAPVEYALGQNAYPRSLAVADVNGDGRADVIVGSSPNGDPPKAVGVLLQNGQGDLDAMVGYPTPRACQVATGDFNHDGRTDVVAICGGGADVLLQDAGGTLSAPASVDVPSHSYSDVAVGDFDGDGRDDLALGGESSWGPNTPTVALLMQQPGGGFGSPILRNVGGPLMVAYGLKAGDLNGDGRADLVVSHSQNLSVFYQAAAGMPASPTNLPPFRAESLAIADINSDGRKDLLGASSAGQVGTFLQSAAGALSAVLTDALPAGPDAASRRALAVGDLDGDGGIDAAVGVQLSTAELTILYRAPLHDLGVSITGVPDPASWGGSIAYTVTLANQGVGAVSGVGLSVTLPAGLSLVSVNPSTPTCTGGGDTVSCALGGLAFRQNKAVTVVARADVLGSVTVGAAGTLTESDPEPANNTATQTTLVELPSCADPVQDGSFEQGQLSIPWKATSTNFGTPICSVGSCGTGAGTAGPRTGIFWAWFGGVNRPELGTLTQTVTLQRGRATLRLYLWNGLSSGYATDYFRVLLDGNPVFAVLAGDPQYRAGYRLVGIDLSAFADGGAHSLRLESDTKGPAITNFSVDDVSIETCPPPTLSVGDVTVTEGDSGITDALVSLTLDGPTTSLVTASYATADGSAAAGSDYLPASGVVTIPPGATATTVRVPVLGDRVLEPDETSSFNVPQATNAIVSDGTGVVTLANDDAGGLAVADTTVIEPGTGSRTAVFTITLSPLATGPVTVNYATQDGTALAGQDYVATSGELSLAPGEPSGIVEVPVNADTEAELPETFALVLSGASGTTIAASTGTATVLDQGYYTVAPCRVVDTRNAAGPTGGGPLSAGAARTFPVAGRCGIPAWAKAVSLNVTVTQPSTAGHLRLFPGGTAVPQVSTLNFVAGLTRANNAVVKLGAGGDLSVFCMLGSGSAHVIVDVNGYFASE